MNKLPMTKAEIIEGNKLIADFMNYIHSNDPDIDAWEMMQLKYHRDWNRLLRVFLKIGTMWHWQIEKFGCRINTPDKIEYGISGSVSNSEDDIRRCCWLAAIDFIKWYNQNSKA